MAPSPMNSEGLRFAQIGMACLGWPRIASLRQNRRTSPHDGPLISFSGDLSGSGSLLHLYPVWPRALNVCWCLGFALDWRSRGQPDPPLGHMRARRVSSSISLIGKRSNLTCFAHCLSPHFRGVPGEGPDGHSPSKTNGFGLVPARIPVGKIFVGFIWAAGFCSVPPPPPPRHPCRLRSLGAG